MGEFIGKVGSVGRPKQEVVDRLTAEKECRKAWLAYKEEYDPREKVPDFVWHEPFKLPPKPKDYKSIINFGKPKEDRKFPYYTDEEVSRYSAKDEKGNYRYPEWIRQELHRRINGLFFFNGDKLEWITGHHYMTLQYWKIPIPTEDGRMTRGKPFFIDAQRDNWYAIKAMREDTDCMGVLLIGYRRFSKTVTALAEGYWDSTENSDSIFPIQSKTEKDAEKVFFKLIDSWKLLPPFLKPIDDGSTSQSKKLVFDYPKRKNVKIDERLNRDALRSRIYFVTSNEVEVDGDYVSYFFRDEFCKTAINNNIREGWYVTKPTLMVGNRIVGKAFYTSTVEDSEKYGSKFGKELWDDSDPNNRNQNNQTESGLYQLFIPAYYGFMGETKDEVFVDEWGYSNIEAAREYHIKNRKRLKSDRLLSEMRKFPLSIHDAWVNKDNENTFDAKRLMEQMAFLREEKPPQLVTGNFEWLNGLKDTKVIWRPDKEGRWERALIPHEDDQCCVRMTGTQRRANRNYFFTGVDAYSNDAAVRYGSNGSGVTLFKNYPHAPTREGVACVYNYRPKTANHFAEDMILQATFYSSPILVERNTGGFRQYFDQRGYKGFLIKNPLEKDPRKKAKEDPGFPNNSKESREDLMNMVASYIMDNFGFNEETGTHGYVYFKDLIQQLIDFDPLSWTKYDIVVAFGLSVIASRAKDNEVEIKKYNLQDWFRV